MIVLKAILKKDCSLIDPILTIDKLVETDMQIVLGENKWSKYYRVYTSENDFEGVLVPIDSIDCLDEDYLKYHAKIEYERKLRQERYIHSWVNIVVNMGPRGGVKEIMYSTLNDEKVKIINKGNSKYYLKLLNECNINYSILKK